MKPERKTYKIGELGRIVTGKTPALCNSIYFGETYPFITPSDMKGQKYAITERSLSDEGAKHLKSCLIPANSVAVSCIGWQMGKSIMTDKPSVTNQQLNSIIPNDKVVPGFLYYSLSMRRDELLSLGAGTGVRTPILNKTAFSELSVELPPLETQLKIASILSAYDELIENNSRRIKILEKMARMLYREWFVNFRFPGHEQVKMVDSPLGLIPEGWEVKPLGGVADIQWGDTSTTKASYVDDGYKTFSASGPDGKLDHYDFDRKGIVLSAIGANCGLTWYVTGKWSCIKNTIRFWASNDLSTEYLFFATRGKDFWPKRGAAQPFISQGDSKAIQIVCPKKSLVEKFSQFTTEVLSEIEALESKNQNLRETRDLLLPKLISGEVAV